MEPGSGKTRRAALQQSLALAGWLAAAGLLPNTAVAQAAASEWNAAAFGAHTLETVLLALGATRPTLSDEVVLTIPDLADNGAVVPVGISTALPGVRRLVRWSRRTRRCWWRYSISDAIDADVALRIKMAESSNVYAAAMLADGRVLYAVKDVQVTLGSCGT
jgi:sulfur-oxidizing protein SoxY